LVLGVSPVPWRKGYCPPHAFVVFTPRMKAILSIVVAIVVVAPAAFADEAKPCDQAKAACDKAKASECTSAKKVCPKAQRQALLTHKGAYLAQR
jgi:hypothetical protein